MKPLILSLAILLSGCSLFWNSHEPPGGITATQGKAAEMKVSWADPSKPDEHIQAVSYTIKRDGSFEGTSLDPSWIDTAADPATRYTYSVSATYSDGSTSDFSGSASGWYVPAEDLVFGTQASVTSTPGSQVTVDGWFETILVKGWSYHFELDSTATLSVCDHAAPWSQTSMGTGASLTWASDRTGSVWIKISPTVAVRAWYQ